MTWNKLITSGSDASLNSLHVDTDITASGELLAKDIYMEATQSVVNEIFDLDFTYNGPMQIFANNNLEITSSNYRRGTRRELFITNADLVNDLVVTTPADWKFIERNDLQIFANAIHKYELTSLSDISSGVVVTEDVYLDFANPYLYTHGYLSNYQTTGVSINNPAPPRQDGNNITIRAAAFDEVQESSTVTDIQVDLTSVNSIEIEWENVGTATINNQSALVVSTIKNGDLQTFDARILNTGIFALQTQTLDVSTLTGNYYVRVHGRDDATDDDDQLVIHLFSLKLI